ncbi:Olfactory Receptor 11H4, partial [Manis pentadactyla]
LMNILSAPSTISGFILLGFPCPKEGQILLFVLFSVVYLLTLMNNGSIICAVSWDQRLHTPIYILLANFSFLDVWFLSYSVSTVQLSQLPFCGPNTINHFVCDMDPLMALSCAPAPVTEMVFYVLSSLIIIVTVLYILGSYTLLLIAVLKVPSAAGRWKAFSTCGSHLIVMCLFFGTLLAMYVSPTADNSAEIQKILTLFYTVVTPFLNPLIYSLQNKEMKAALKKVLRIE